MVTSLWAGHSRVWFLGAGKRYFLFSRTPTQLLFKWVLVVKQAERKADHSPPKNDDVKKERRYASAPSICLHGMQRENITITDDFLTPSFHLVDNLHFVSYTHIAWLQFMLGTAISYTETYEKGWKKFQKFVSPLTEKLHAWLADIASETEQFREFTYEIINSSFSLSPCPHFISQSTRT
jgi:hypothetical protein